MTSSLDLKEVLETVTQGLFDYMGAAFARIWLLLPGIGAPNAAMR